MRETRKKRKGGDGTPFNISDKLELIWGLFSSLDNKNIKTLFTIITEKNRIELLTNDENATNEIKKILDLFLGTTSGKTNKKVLDLISSKSDTLLTSIDKGEYYIDLLLSFISVIDYDVKIKSLKIFLDDSNQNDIIISENDDAIINNVLNFINSLLELLKEFLKTKTPTYNILILIQLFLNNIKNNKGANLQEKKTRLFLIAILANYENIKGCKTNAASINSMTTETDAPENINNDNFTVSKKINSLVRKAKQHTRKNYLCEFNLIRSKKKKM